MSVYTIQIAEYPYPSIPQISYCLTIISIFGSFAQLHCSAKVNVNPEFIHYEEGVQTWGADWEKSVFCWVLLLPEATRNLMNILFLIISFQVEEILKYTVKTSLLWIQLLFPPSPEISIWRSNVFQKWVGSHNLGF